MNCITILKHSLALAVITLAMSCSQKENKSNPSNPNDELKGLALVTTIANATHKVELYTANGKFQTGYNAVDFQIKNMDGTPVNNATVSWMPMMDMGIKKHSCPSSAITKKQNMNSTYTGYIVFQMSGAWGLKLAYTVNGTEYTVEDKTIEVAKTPKSIVSVFTGIDSQKYVLAMIEPTNPKIGSNDMSAILYKTEEMMTFTKAEGYTIKIKPIMPAMGHGSPNNVDLTQGDDGMYHGKVNFTMTGYWKINLQVEDASQKIIGGETIIDETKDSSSIYFELEF